MFTLLILSHLHVERKHSSVVTFASHVLDVLLSFSTLCISLCPSWQTYQLRSHSGEHNLEDSICRQEFVPGLSTVEADPLLKFLSCLRPLVELRHFHCIQRSWRETLSLQFCQDKRPKLNLENLELVSLQTDLLCLATGVDGKFIFCNPLTISRHRLRRKA